MLVLGDHRLLETLIHILKAFEELILQTNSRDDSNGVNCHNSDNPPQTSR